MTLNDLLGTLPTLSQRDLATLRAAIDTLSVDDTRSCDSTVPLYQAMTQLLGVSLSYRDFHNVQTYKTWKQKAPGVVAFIERTFPNARNVAKTAMMSFLIEALVDDLKARGVPVTLGVVAVNIDRLPKVFDLCFPGYKESGLAHLVLKTMEKSK